MQLLIGPPGNEGLGLEAEDGVQARGLCLVKSGLSRLAIPVPERAAPRDNRRFAASIDWNATYDRRCRKLGACHFGRRGGVMLTIRNVPWALVCPASPQVEIRPPLTRMSLFGNVV